MIKFKTISGIVIVSLTLAAVLALTPAQSRTQPTSAVGAPFDYSNCQYPNRWSNPVDGCDNSDPAVPSCIKASSTQEGEALCIATFVKANEQPAVQPVVAPPTTTEQQTKTCGGIK